MNILVVANPYQGRVPYLYLRVHKIVLKRPNPTINRTAVNIVEVTNIKERDLIQFDFAEFMDFHNKLKIGGKTIEILTILQMLDQTVK